MTIAMLLSNTVRSAARFADARALHDKKVPA
jgi:hypothetical protein